jgi:hypothetical protein
MSFPELVQWQWRGYPANHAGRANLLIHLFVVPLFLAGNIGLVIALVERWPLWAIASALAMIVSVALQGAGHRREKVPPEPFTSRANAVARIFVEQWITFPRFVLSGGWFRALRDDVRAASVH